MKEKNNKTKGKLVHNYIILIVIFALVVGVVIYLCRWYNVYSEYQMETPVIRGTLQEIVSDDLEHYVLDNPSALIYICTSNDKVCRDFEKDFKKLLKKNDYSDVIVYLNISGIDQDQFVNSFNDKYYYKSGLTVNYPAFVLFEDGRIVSILQGNENSDLTVSDVKHFLELNKIGE